MFDNDFKDTGISAGVWDTSDPWSRLPQTEPGTMTPANPLDGPNAQQLHRRLIAMYEDELERQAENRTDMAVDADFYDSIQWRQEDVDTLKDRGQVPLVYNVIAASVNWVLGTEKRGRTDYRVLPRRKDAAKPAQRKTELLKYLSDVNQTPFNRSRAFEDAVKVGIGWMEACVQDEDGGEPVQDRYVSWREMLWDSAGSEKNLKDCRYVIRSKWLDLDVAEAYFPDRADVLRQSAAGNNNYGLDRLGDEAMDSRENDLIGYSSIRSAVDGIRRERVRVIEIWFRKPVTALRMIGGEFSGEVYDHEDPAPGHLDSIERGDGVPEQRTMMRMHVALMVDTGLLYVNQSPYRHNDFPFTPIWCYRRDRDNLPYGIIRPVRDVQEDINKRASKALYILSTNKVLMEEGAVDDLEELAEENARPDGIIRYKKGYKLQLGVDRELAPAHLDIMSRSIAMIQTLTGVTDESMGRTTNATSGVAIGRRQEQGAMTTAGIFDNLRLAVQLHGQKTLSLVEQYFTEEKSFRITNSRGVPDYITINDSLPENDIVRTKADFVISDQDWRITIRQAQTEELFALLQQIAPVAPQVPLVMLDLIVEGMDMPQRDEMVARIRQITGQRDPDQTEMTPEEQAAQAQKDQAAQQQQELQMRAALADIAVKEAKAGRDQAAIQKDQALIRQIMGALAGQNIQTQQNALQAALMAIGTPGAVRVADAMLHESGFVSRSEEEDVAAQAEQVQAAQQLQQQQLQQQQQEQQSADQQQQDAQDQQQFQQQAESFGLGVPK